MHATTWNLITLRQGTAIQFYLGVDGLNLWLVVLTALLMVSAVLVSWTSVTERDNEFFAWLLALEAAMIGVFLAFDIVLFYVFFELTLVPLFFLIGIWGGPQRQYAARKFFIFTLAGSLITLLGVLGVVLAVGQRPLRPAEPETKRTADELTFSIPRWSSWSAATRPTCRRTSRRTMRPPPRTNATRKSLKTIGMKAPGPSGLLALGGVPGVRRP